MNLELDGKVGIVTGGSSGIGKAVTEKLVEEGAEVVVADVDGDRGEAVAEEIGCEFRECDVSDWENMKDVVASTVDDYGHLDIVVNNAGIGAVHGIDEMEIEEWRKVLSVDLDGVMHGTKAAIGHLKESGGCVVNIASIYGLVGDVGSTAYTAAKGGVVNFTRSVANDVAQDGVRVNSVCPGYVDTPMTEEALSDDDFRAHVEGETPMGRVADPEEIADVVAFVASDRASYMTGENVAVDGGWTSH